MQYPVPPLVPPEDSTAEHPRWRLATIGPSYRRFKHLPVGGRQDGSIEVVRGEADLVDLPRDHPYVARLFTEGLNRKHFVVRNRLGDLG